MSENKLNLSQVALIDQHNNPLSKLTLYYKSSLREHQEIICIIRASLTLITLFIN